MINFDFSGKTYLITGASSGIGAAVAELIYKSGGNLVLIARDKTKLRTESKKLGNCPFYSIDLSSVSEIEHSLIPIIKECGPFDGFVHSAGLGTVRPLKLCSYEFMKNIMDVNFFSFVEIIRLLTRKGNFGEKMSIVGISSVASLEGNQSKTAYCASKAAMDSSIRCMAKELAPKGVRVNSVMPGITRTAIFDQIIDNGTDSSDLNNILARQYLGVCEPNAVASAVAFLLSDDAKFITGSSIPVDSGRLSS